MQYPILKEMELEFTDGHRRRTFFRITFRC